MEIYILTCVLFLCLKARATSRMESAEDEDMDLVAAVDEYDAQGEYTIKK